MASNRRWFTGRSSGIRPINAKPRRTKAYLLGRLLSGQVKRRRIRARGRRRRLQRQRRLPYPRIARQKHNRATHHAAAKHAVQFRNTEHEASRRLGRKISHPGRDSARHRASTRPSQTTAHRRRYLLNCVPGPAPAALPLPARANTAAIGTLKRTLTTRSRQITRPTGGRTRRGTWQCAPTAVRTC